MQDIATIYRDRFQRNIRALAEEDPALHARVENTAGEGRLVKAEDGGLTMKSGSVYIESRVSPRKQALRFARLHKEGGDRFLFLGCGLGYHINELLGAGGTGILVEHSIEIFRAALFVLEPAVVGRLLLLIGLPAEEAVGKITYKKLAGSTVVAYPVSERVSPRYYKAVGNAVRRMLKQKLASETTTAFSQRLWVRNVIRNIGSPFKSYRLLRKGCAGRFSGPVLLVASGPWLEEAMDRIAGPVRGLPVFSLLPSLPYLLSRGVKPDLVLSTDAGFYNRERARGALDAAGMLRIPLVTTFSADPGVLRCWRGKVVLFSHGLAVETLFGDITGDALSIPMQGTSALVMILIARMLGFDPIILAGYDFAVDGIRDHHRGAGFDTFDLAKSGRFFRWDTAVVSRLVAEGFYRIGDGRKSKDGDDSVISESADSGGISTSYKLSLYREWFQDRIVRPDLMILNDAREMNGIRAALEAHGPVSSGIGKELEPFEVMLEPTAVLEVLRTVKQELSTRASYEKRYEMLCGARSAGGNPRLREDVNCIMDLIDSIIAATGQRSGQNNAVPPV